MTTSRGGGRCTVRKRFVPSAAVIIPDAPERNRAASSAASGSPALWLFSETRRSSPVAGVGDDDRRFTRLAHGVERAQQVELHGLSPTTGRRTRGSRSLSER